MSDDAIIVPGSVEWLGEMVKTSVMQADEAKRRFWRATDEVARLRRDLSSAEERLAIAEREYHDSGKLMTEMWGQLRAELENARPAKDAPDVWSDELPPGGMVCGVCGQPTESEPCAEHQPIAAARP
jgi:hypothetical protein